ncbi:uncharacterized protein LOC113357985 [Papaver somniferum]|uniref:uncharacterized protein LOC113357985 n=1 Tax=Papaver somniferum TaxID=3469 RepID=UPI000E6F86BC|nr:uncharacterized protein LOC113357985 [Papaver somniferum]XP_026457267.1 uncharacterized protein LOC113357985 [Papaver somniferum]XP_026457268.1 uncharacterized protein LOC113357985 [Papaver somniferum]XP_026457269.1 uncharacterized protein LOC113357985 [Papaver somniferum]
MESTSIKLGMIWSETSSEFVPEKQSVGRYVSDEDSRRDIVKHDSSRVEVSSGNSFGGDKNVRYAGERKVMRGTHPTVESAAQTSLQQGTCPSTPVSVHQVCYRRRRAKYSQL